MKRIQFGIFAIATLLMWSCSHNNRYEMSLEQTDIAMKEAELEEEVSISENLNNSPEKYISSSAALENLNDTTRKMIRTANIKFKVKDVIKTTYNIENIVVKHNGVVENTNLASQTNSSKETTIMEDSVLLTTYYTVINTLVLRVPNTKLDTTLKEIAQFIDFMDYRIIDARDVTLDLLSKKLEIIRLEQYERRMVNAIDNTGTKLNDVSDAENNLLRKQEQADESKLANLNILDKIKFSTITLSLYQNQSIKYEVIAKEKKIKPYSTPFGNRFIEALKFGWTILVEFSIFLINIWSIILFAILVLFGLKYYKKRSKDRNKKRQTKDAST